MLTRESLGPAHPLYIHNMGEYTQTAVWEGTKLVCVFVDQFSKLNAAAYINGRTKEIDMDQPF